MLIQQTNDTPGVDTSPALADPNEWVIHAYCKLGFVRDSMTPEAVEIVQNFLGPLPSSPPQGATECFAKCNDYSCVRAGHCMGLNQREAAADAQSVERFPEQQFASHLSSPPQDKQDGTDKAVASTAAGEDTPTPWVDARCFDAEIGEDSDGRRVFKEVVSLDNARSLERLVHQQHEALLKCGAAKLSDGTYLDKDGQIALALAAYREFVAKEGK